MYILFLFWPKGSDKPQYNFQFCLERQFGLINRLGVHILIVHSSINIRIINSIVKKYGGSYHTIVIGIHDGT